MPASYFGGPKVYTTSIYPLVQAFLMKFSPSIPSFLLINHLAETAMSAGYVVILFALLKRILRPLNAFLLTAVFFTYPMFHSMAATINMDLPVGFFSLLAVWLYMKKQNSWMLAALVVAILIKQTAGIAVIAIAILSVLQISKRTDIKWILLLLIPLVIACANPIVGLIEPKELCGSESTLIVSDWLLNPKTIFDRVKTLFDFVPDQTVVLMLFFCISIVYGIVVLVHVARKVSLKSIRSIADLQTFVGQRELGLLCAALIIGFTLLYYSISIILPRYTIWVFPYVLILTAVLFRRVQMVLTIASVIFIGCNIINHTGYLYRLHTMNFNRLQQPHNLHGFAMYLERSMEFKDDMILNQKMVAFAEDQLQECDIITCWPYTHMLAAPEFGYVKKPLSVYSISGVNKTGLPALHVPHYTTWRANPEKPKPLVFITTISNYFMAVQFNPQHHHLVHEIRYKDRVVHFYQQK